MQSFTLSLLMAIVGLTAGGHLNNGATSYLVLTKHEPSSNHYDHDWSRHSSDHGHGGWYHNDYHSYPKYEFKYGVENSKTGDIKNQWEHRDGDHVKGSYSFKEADGTTRIVDYHANGHHGFNAVVKTLGHAHYPEVRHRHGAWEGGYALESRDHGYGHATSYANFYLH
uniref:Uncharacterized protein n=1 Tax=Stomoxys calcitrans TaxID=35570 RepID=A0A1I8P1M2_STOCA